MSAPEPLEDQQVNYQITESEVVGSGRLLTLMSETLDYKGESITREFVRHPGAVAVLALDADDRVLLIRQYRHPLRSLEWELPAGLLDVPDEPRAIAAQRELVEETGMSASEWMLLLDMAVSPGGSNEVVSIFLARGLVEIESDYVRDAEEADIEVRWEQLEDVAAAAAAGKLRNGILIGGVFAALAARAQGWSSLRPADADVNP
jgi:ADP-ribose pyrophosphatase